MLVIVETAIITAYMLNNYLGMVLMGGASIYVLFFSKKESRFYKLLELMVMSLPMAYIGIAGIGMHQLFSWYNLYLLLFLVNVSKYYSFCIPLKKMLRWGL